MRFFLGLLLGLVGLGGYIGYERYERERDPCRGHCGPETVCVGGLCEGAVAEAKPMAKKKRRRRRRRRRRPSAPGATGESPPAQQPTAADLKAIRSGPSLKGTDYIDAAEAGGGGRELTTAEVTSRFRARDRRIVACIDRARGDYDIDRGKIIVGFRIERGGEVKKVQVTGPAVMQRQGLSECVKPLVTSLRFPASSRALVMSFPYGLN